MPPKPKIDPSFPRTAPTAFHIFQRQFFRTLASASALANHQGHFNNAAAAKPHPAKLVTDKWKSLKPAERKLWTDEGVCVSGKLSG